MNAKEIRKKYLDFFQEHGHTLVPSSPVIPHGDPTLLFTNAGMNQFKEIFTGKQPARFPCATTAQKCIRAGGKHNDLDNVGYTARHLTFFEMLGNFSFGDYFKEDAIAYAWDLVTKRFGVSKRRVWITVFQEDDEARAIWRRVAGLAEDRIVGLGEKDNFWSMGDVGPCGPCSEILIDRGDAYGPQDLDNGDRFFEIWNLVFMQFEQKSDGTRSPLPRPSIDTGMGLERMAMVLQGTESVFETDLFRPLIERVVELSGTPYDPGPAGVPHRVLADHVRSLVFAFADGAEPSNEGRGYVLRRILRRGARYGRKIHVEGPILCRLVDVVVREMGDVYPDIAARGEFIARLIRHEEERFGETLEEGIQRFDDVVARMRTQGCTVIPGAEVFTLYDTFGFPVDLVERMADEQSFTVDMGGFDRLMAEQKERSRGASKFGVVDRAADGLDLEKLPESRFVGYQTTRARAELLAAAELGGTWRVLLSETPFYAESGGQVGDVGTLRGDGFLLRVDDTQREAGWVVHLCRLENGSPDQLRSGAAVEALVDETRRASTARNHTATHLLHAALRQVAGSHVHQKGSLVEPGRLRFDVTHFSGFRPEELREAERIVRERIRENLLVETEETDYETAAGRGAMALFGEKYGDRVRLVRIADFSLELCGGTHVRRTGDIGAFEIVGEGSVSAGVRRLEAVTAFGAEELYRNQRELLEKLAAALKVPQDAVLERVERLLAENRELRSRRKALPAEGPEAAVRREDVAGVRFVSGVLGDLDGKALREAYDRYKKEAERQVTALASRSGERVQLLVGVSAALVAAGWDAREILRRGAERIGGRGGGRPELAQAGAKADEPALEEAIRELRATLQEKGKA